MELEIYRTLYENFDTNSDVNYERLVNRYVYYLLQFIESNENEFYKNMSYLENIVNGMDYVNRYFSLENDFNNIELNKYVETKKTEIIDSVKNKNFNLENLIYYLTSECYELFDDNIQLYDKLVLLMVKNCYIIEKILKSNLKIPNYYYKN